MKFEPFAVQCTTCASRLRVTDPAIVGTIANCPKCNSMVEITSPSLPQPSAQQVAVGSPQVDSEAITEEAIAADTTPQLDPATAPRGFDGDDTLSPQPDAFTGDAFGGPMSPTWQSERTQKSRQIALIVAIAGSGLIASILMFSWFVKNWPTKNQPVADATQDPVSASVDNPTGESPEEAVEANAADSDQSSDDTPAAVDNADADHPDENDNAPSTIATETTIAKRDPDAPDTSVPLPNVSPPSDLLSPSALDPLGLDTPPKNMRPNDNSFPGDPADDISEPTGPIDLPDGVRKYVDILNLQGGQDAPALDAPATLDDIKLEGPAIENVDPMMVANPPEPINFKRALAMKLALAPTQNDAYPLNDLILLLSQVSGVPVQIDWVSFDLMGVNIRDGVGNLKAYGGRSIDELLNLIAKSVDGEIIRTETLLTLAPSDAAFQAKLVELLDTSDFGSGQTSAVETINAFLLGAGQPGTNAKQVKAGPKRHDQQVAALAVESMRRIRAVKGKIPDEVLRRWAQSAADKRLDWPLVVGGDSGKPLLSPLTMAGALRRLSRQNNATCFINWLDANRREMAPQQLVMPFMNGDAGEVLVQLLQPFDLQVRLVDEQHWWVGTEATYDRFPVAVWTQPLGQSQDEFVRRITAALGNDETKLAIDPDTGRALMLLPRYVVRQLPKLTEGLK